MHGDGGNILYLTISSAYMRTFGGSNLGSRDNFIEEMKMAHFNN